MIGSFSKEIGQGKLLGLLKSNGEWQVSLLEDVDSYNSTLQGISPAKRLRECKKYEDNIYIYRHFPDKLFCKACEKTVDHSGTSS